MDLNNRDIQSLFSSGLGYVYQARQFPKLVLSASSLPGKPADSRVKLHLSF
jgi:hypothetical protein